MTRNSQQANDSHAEHDAQQDDVPHRLIASAIRLYGKQGLLNGLCDTSLL